MLCPDRTLCHLSSICFQILLHDELVAARFYCLLFLVKNVKFYTLNLFFTQGLLSLVLSLLISSHCKKFFSVK